MRRREIVSRARAVLRAAADLIEPEGAWCHGAYAKDRRGQTVPPDSPRAERYCMLGAIMRVVCHDDSERAVVSQAESMLHDAVDGVDVLSFGLLDWNDKPGRKQADVVAALRKAARWKEKSCDTK